MTVALRQVQLVLEWATNLKAGKPSAPEFSQWEPMGIVAHGFFTDEIPFTMSYQQCQSTIGR